MTKKELVDFLAPFDDDIKVVVRGANLIGPLTYELQYLPFTDERPAIVAIKISGVGFVNTHQGA